MPSALDVADHIIQYCHSHGCRISNLRLQILLYMAQAYFLVKSDGKKPCFEERIEARSYGPVIPEVYKEYRKYGSLDIMDCRNPNAIPLSKVDMMMVDEVVDYFMDHSLLDLVDLVLSQSPWRNAFHPFCNQEITKDSLLNYFK